MGNLFIGEVHWFHKPLSENGFQYNSIRGCVRGFYCNKAPEGISLENGKFRYGSQCRSSAHGPTLVALEPIVRECIKARSAIIYSQPGDQEAKEQRLGSTVILYKHPFSTLHMTGPHLSLSLFLIYKHLLSAFYVLIFLGLGAHQQTNPKCPPLWSLPLHGRLKRNVKWHFSKY